MKITHRIILLLLLAVTIPFTIASAQEKKNEKKIKIVLDDGAGAKTVLDTTITDGTVPQTITTKEGKIIFIGESQKKHETSGGEKMVHVMVTDDTDGDKEETEKIIIMSGDGGTWTTTTSGDDKKNFTVKVESGEIEKDTDVSKYIIAKDGIVVTVESDDEAKAKELIKVIEDKLEVKK